MNIATTLVLILTLCSIVTAFSVRDKQYQKDLLAKGYSIDDSLPFQTTFSKKDHAVLFPKQLDVDFAMKNTHKLNDGNNYDFIPRHKASLRNNTESEKWKTRCFRDTSAILDVGKKGKLTFTVHNPDGLLCADWYLLATPSQMHIVQIDRWLPKTVEIVWKEDDVPYVLNRGLQVFYFPDGGYETVVNLITTWYSLFYCGPNMEEHNLKFLKDRVNITYQTRKQDEVVLEKKDIKSGMYLAITRLDGLDPMIMWGTGSRTGHTAVTMWIENELYVLESTSDPFPITCKYWPGKEDVMKTPWDKWIANAKKAKFLVSVFPLSPENQKKFNETKAIEWFKTVDGLPYGMSNFVFGWIDTEEKNFPDGLTDELLLSIFSLLDRIYESAADTGYMNGIKLRLKELGEKECNDFECIMDVLLKRNMTFGALLAMPEMDWFVYPDGRQMVCDVFVLSIYKAGGIFGELTDKFQAAEQTPRDAYTLDIYDHHWKRPKPCEVDDLPQCQLLGKYKLELPVWNSLKVYEKINEKCESQPFLYERCPGVPLPSNNCKC